MSATVNYRDYRHAGKAIFRPQVEAPAADYFHWSGMPIGTLYSVAQFKDDLARPKPSGIWLAENDHWHRWVKENTCWPIGEYCYQTEFDRARMLMLHDGSDVLSFTKHYGDFHRSAGDHIYWDAVAEHYAGILITDDVLCLKWEAGWLYGWDVPSACIWDHTIITHFQLLNP